MAKVCHARSLDSRPPLRSLPHTDENRPAQHSDQIVKPPLRRAGRSTAECREHREQASACGDCGRRGSKSRQRRCNLCRLRHSPSLREGFWTGSELQARRCAAKIRPPGAQQLGMIHSSRVICKTLANPRLGRGFRGGSDSVNAAEIQQPGALKPRTIHSNRRFRNTFTSGETLPSRPQEGLRFAATGAPPGGR